MTPLRITVGFLKGGSGKTTTSVMLALALAKLDNKPVHLVDADTANPSAWQWTDSLGNQLPDAVVVNRWPSESISRHVRVGVPSDHHLIIDTGPACDKTLRAALHVTDTLVMPMTHTPVEMGRIKPTLTHWAEVDNVKPTNLSIVLTRVRSATRSAREARKALIERGLPVASTVIRHLEMYAQSHGTVPSDLGEYEDLLVELQALTSPSQEQENTHD